MPIGWLLGKAIREISIASDPVIINIEEEKFEGFNVFGLYVKGSFKIPWTKSGLVYMIQMYEVDINGKELPVLCRLEGLNNNGVFQWISDPIDSQSGAYQVKTLTRIMNIPVDALIFSRKGNLSLSFELKIVTFDNNLQPSVLKEAKSTLNYINVNSGYEDIIAKNNVFASNVVELGNIVINIDGEASSSEIQIVNKWITENVNNDEDQTKLLNQVKQYPNKGFSLEQLRNNAKKAIKDIEKVADASDKIALLKLLHDISIADGQRDNDEHQIIKAVISKLGIDQEKYSQIFSKSVNLDASTTDSELETLIGLHAGMLLEQKITQLKKAFKEWNGKITSPNKIEAANAKIVLEFISKKRNQLEAE